MAASDVVTLDETRRALAITTNTHDTLLAAWITAVSARMDDYAGAIVKRTVTNETHNGGWYWIRPKYQPVASVTTVEEKVGTTVTALTAESYSTAPASAYLLDGQMIYRRETGSQVKFADGQLNIRITYVAGRADSTSAVSEQFKRAALIILRHMWRAEHGTGNVAIATGDGDLVVVGGNWLIPRAARDLLGSELEPKITIA